MLNVPRTQLKLSHSQIEFRLSLNALIISFFFLKKFLFSLREKNLTTLRLFWNISKGNFSFSFSLIKSNNETITKNVLCFRLLHGNYEFDANTFWAKAMTIKMITVQKVSHWHDEEWLTMIFTFVLATLKVGLWVAWHIIKTKAR